MSMLNDSGAEATVLAAGLAQANLIETMAALDPGVFFTENHRLIHSALIGLYRANDPRDHATVARRAAQAAVSGAQANAVTHAVMGMIGQGRDFSVGFFIDRLKNLHTARSVEAAGVRLQEVAHKAAESDDPTLLTDGVGWVKSELGDVSNDVESTEDDLPMSLGELLDKKFEHDWLVPELFERMDRLILTGLEGTGKSYLVAQLAMTIAAGLHPFLGVPMTGHNQVLIIDAENSERQTGRRYKMMQHRIVELCRLHGQDVPDWDRMVRMVLRPEGIPLNDPRTVKTIERAIAATKPAFVAMGPLYRLHRLDTRDEQAAKELTDVIDRLRVKYRFTVVCEAHVAHGQQGQQRALRPTGSSLFLRWPEFGVGLRPSQGTDSQQHPSTVDLSMWRGGREERMWPRFLQHGVEDHHLPWNNGDGDYRRDAQIRGYL